MHKVTLWFTIGIITTAGIGAAAAPTQIKNAATHTFRDSPVGRLIQGQVGRMLTLRSELNLTDQQRTLIRQIITNHKPELASLAKQIVEQKRAIREAVIKPDNQEADIHKAAENLAKTITQTAVLAGQIRAEVFAVLTVKQRQLIESSITDRHQAVDRWLDEIAQ
ncbi:MAG TPA: hypothetical protein DER01_19585 [Phycisphaerales bacterium]|nr:hypothetical protein [Phycisphaerales bacterium]|tara:strand:+ start:409 stop:903 length:495 start_codon:yes stop_codon:yes gene_type:complete